jgi:hypothetical protein
MPLGGVTLFGVSLWVPYPVRIHVKNLDRCGLDNGVMMRRHPLCERRRGASVPLGLAPLSSMDKFGSCLKTSSAGVGLARRPSILYT